MICANYAICGVMISEIIILYALQSMDLAKKSIYISNVKTSSRMFRKLGRLDELLERFSKSKESMMDWVRKEARHRSTW